MPYRLRYRPDTTLGQRFPTTTYPTHGGYVDRERAETVMAACPGGESMEIVEVAG